MSISYLNRRQALGAIGAVISGASIATGSTAADESDGPQTFSTNLSGDAEVPPVKTNASGRATFALSEDRSELQYEVYIDCIRNVNQGHIHLGTESENGPIVAWLHQQEAQEPETIEGLSREFVFAEGTLTKEDLVEDLENESLDALVVAMETGGAYVNIHSEQNPEGEIRGQVEADELPEGPFEEPEEDPEESSETHILTVHILNTEDEPVEDFALQVDGAPTEPLEDDPIGIMTVQLSDGTYDLRAAGYPTYMHDTTTITIDGADTEITMRLPRGPGDE